MIRPSLFDIRYSNRAGAPARKPSLLFINQHYHPDYAATGQMLTDLAEYLAAEGFDVRVLCSRARYLSGTLAVPGQEEVAGVRVYRIGATGFGRGRHLGRLLDYASFYGQVLWHTLLGPPCDCVITLTTPPLLGFLGALLRGLRGQRYGIWSMDLHPDAEEAVGLLRPGRAPARLLHRLNDAGYRHADFVVDLGPFMKARLVRKGVAPARLHTIPVWHKQSEVQPVPHAENTLRAELGLADRFVVMYSGNAGLVHRFDEVLAAMRALKDHPAFFFLFVGDGPRKREILAYAARFEIRNFRYLAYFPRQRLSASLSLADVHLLTLRGGMAGIAVPSKLYGIMAAARPVVMVGPEASEPGWTVLAEGAGYVVDPEKHPEPAERLAGVLLHLFEHPEQRRALGARGRAAFLARYTHRQGCVAWAALLNERLRDPA